MRSTLITILPILIFLVPIQLRFLFVKPAGGQGSWADFSALPFKFLGTLFFMTFAVGLAADLVNRICGYPNVPDSWDPVYRRMSILWLLVCAQLVWRSWLRFRNAVKSTGRKDNTLALVALYGIIVFCGSAAYGIRCMASRTEDVRELCRVKAGTAIEEAIEKGRSLGFSWKRRGYSLGAYVRADGVPPIPADEQLTGINNGQLSWGKVSLPPFMINTCHITFRERKVVSTSTTTID